MANISKVTITINASPEKVWQHLMNPEDLKHWLTGFVSAKSLTGTPGETGSTSQLIFKERGKEIAVTETVILSNPRQQYTFRMDAAAFSSNNDIRLVSFGQRTELVQTVEFIPKGFFMKLLMPLIKGAMKKRMLTELLKFKSFVETSSS